MTMNTDRIANVERQVGEVRAVLGRHDEKLDNIVETLQSLVRIEERQIGSREQVDRLSASEKRNEERLRALELAMPQDMNKRLSIIETHMPGLIESRKWVVGGVLAGISLIGLGVVKLVMVAP